MTIPADDRTLPRGVAMVAAIAAIVGLGLFAPAEPARSQSMRGGVGAMPRSLIPPMLLVGDWLTVINTDGRPQAVRLKIHTIEPGKTAGKLIYAAPRRCTVDLEYGGPDRGQHVFYIVPFTNCFRYQSTDTVVLMSAQDLPSAFNDLSQVSPSYRLMPKDQKADTGAAASDADPARAAAPKPMIDRMQYVINLGDRAIETGLMARQ